jgi:hypothetical protein
MKGLAFIKDPGGLWCYVTEVHQQNSVYHFVLCRGRSLLREVTCCTLWLNEWPGG